ncbi:MAG TPA: DNA-directed RNA polymerase subunit omega [Armatimonadota bacterium]|nr:DNA-directed RNA polymerase subunit omega [Armatimonadota bacterium]
MVDPSGDEANNGTGSRYALVMAVAKRAKQLRNGAPKLVDIKSRNPITIALEEIATGKLGIVIPTPEELEAASRELKARPEPTEAAELLRIPDEEEQEVEPVEAPVAAVESPEEAPSEVLAQPEEASLPAEAGGEAQIAAAIGEEEQEEPVEAAAPEIESPEEASSEALTGVAEPEEASAESDKEPQTTAEVGEEEQTEEVEE